MTDPLAFKQFAIIVDESGSRPLFLSPFRRARTILIDEAPLEPQYTMDRVEAEDYVARLKPWYPRAKFEIVETRLLDAAALSRRYDASLLRREPTNRRNSDYGARLAARMDADSAFNKHRPVLVERKRPKLRKPNSAQIDDNLVRRIMKKIAENGERSTGCYVPTFQVPGYSSEIVSQHLIYLFQYGYLEITPGPSGAEETLARYHITDKGGDWLYTELNDDEDAA